MSLDDNEIKQSSFVKRVPAIRPSLPEITTPYQSSPNKNGPNRIKTPSELVQETELIFNKFLEHKRSSSKSDNDILKVIKRTSNNIDELRSSKLFASKSKSNDAELSDEELNIKWADGRKKKKLFTRIKERLSRTFSINRSNSVKSKLSIDSDKIYKDRRRTIHETNLLQTKNKETADSNTKLKYIFKSLRSQNKSHKKTRSIETFNKVDCILTKEEKLLLSKKSSHSFEEKATFRITQDPVRLSRGIPNNNKLKKQKENLKDEEKIERRLNLDLKISSSVDPKILSDSTDFSPSPTTSFHSWPKEKQDKYYAKIVSKLIKYGDEIEATHIEIKQRSNSSSDFTDNNEKFKVKGKKRRISLPSKVPRLDSNSYSQTMSTLLRSTSYTNFQSAIMPFVNQQYSFVEQVAVLFHLTTNAIDEEPSLVERFKSFCLQYFQDRLSGLIANQGGWESVIEDSNDDEID